MAIALQVWSNCFSHELNIYCHLSDIFLTCDVGRGGKKYQVWVNKKKEGFSLSQEGQLPFGTQAISFADIGLTFIIFKLWRTLISWMFQIEMEQLT
jgi:hypothetical protein